MTKSCDLREKCYKFLLICMHVCIAISVGSLDWYTYGSFILGRVVHSIQSETCI